MAATQHSIDLARAAAEAAIDKLASSVVAIDVSDQLALTDVFVIAAADNDRQVAAVVDAVEERLLQDKVKPIRREGRAGDRWVLLDFGDIVVHIQHEEERAFYALDRLWRDCPIVEVPGAPTPADEA